ncbi:hypothetical protein TG4357_02073 [Thalassovita gelatinovora]|uniref:Uncharacterized protein n=1 Tax=Thalassovita gelatinovora TaxID=53501 RepID=A0A0P1G229_THAGE|nr:hypothetical protein [Thalassovita gelatinovora]QIZ80429.1 hypothetical protein HFZ77_08030 [Thalassovita gelatinovora]CUH65817.1 hypothetical protein TG4357_02073 [Thalassovita gelatinovora]SEQ72286.1 hypothetical protein SAMN04488043_10823 [Thalassovita gelatinovora]
MDSDLVLVVGVTVLGLSIPSIVSNWSDGVIPRVPVLSLLLGVALTVYAYVLKADGVDLADIPMAYVRVVGRFLN